ncbi:MAG: hypothetical protein HZY76_01295 [Anaerolineae bacterium]|nr:MAG: hypothetical protein HZY76_01295 [Anaerolineae bacterium]
MGWVQQPPPDPPPVVFADDPFLRNAGRQIGDEPPLYYALPALVCSLPLPLPAQVHLMRLVSGLFFVATAPVAWWAVRPLWPQRIAPVAAVAGTVAGLPMLAFLSAGVNNDSAVALAGALTFGLLVRYVRRPRLAGVGRCAVQSVGGLRQKRALCWRRWPWRCWVGGWFRPGGDCIGSGSWPSCCWPCCSWP